MHTVLYYAPIYLQRRKRWYYFTTEKLEAKLLYHDNGLYTPYFHV